MSTSADEGPKLDSPSDDHHLLLRPLVAVRSSFIAFIVAIGLVLFLTAVLTSGPIAGILAVLGSSALLYAVLGELGLRAIGYK